MLSIVVPVYRVLPFLRECLDSVLDQAFGDFEVVAIDDRSPDRCAEILREYAARDPRVRVLSNERNLGLGESRNVGIAAAWGRYLMFLDSDDALAPGTLQHVAQSIGDSPGVDLLVVNHARWYWWGLKRRNAQSRLLERLAELGTFAPVDHQELFGNLQVAWNKVYRLEVLRDNGLRFRTGYYEDIPWCYAATMAARSVRVIPVVGVWYRQRRSGSILVSPGRRHFDVFEQWEAVWQFAAERPDRERWVATIYARMVAHLFTVLRHPTRIDRHDRREFFDRMRDLLGRHEVAGFLPRTREDQLRYRLVRAGQFRRYEAMRRMAHYRATARYQAKQARREAERLTSAAGSQVRSLQYHRALGRPVDEATVAYCAYWGRQFACNPAAISAAAAALTPGHHGVWVVTTGGEAAMPEGVPWVRQGSRAYYELMATAAYWVNNANFPDEIVKRPDQFHLQTQHGTPLKHMGLDLMRHPAAAKDMDFGLLLRRSDRWDASLSANRFSSEVWESAFPCSFQSWEYGYPRNDAFYAADAGRVARLRQELGLPSGTTAVLYAPTHRDWEKGYQPRLHLEDLCRRLGPDVVVLVRSHYFYRGARVAPDVASQVRDVSHHASIEELCLASDLLVTDYSSIQFDYANLGRPIVIFADDYQTYRDVRGTYFDLLAEPPGAVATTQAQLTEILGSGSYAAPEHAARLHTFRDRFCEFDDGHAAERVVRRMFLGEEVPLPIVPLAQRSPAPAPSDRAVLEVLAALAEAG